MVKTHISSKGQTTIPLHFRTRWKSTEVVWQEMPDGSASVRPIPDIMSLFGSAHTSQPRDPNEKDTSRAAWAAASEKQKAGR